MRWSLATVALVPRGSAALANEAEQTRIIRWAQRAGFAGIEVSPQWLDMDVPLSSLIVFRRAAERAGLAISGINVNRCLFTRGPQAKAALARMVRALEVAAVLGTRLVTISLSLPLAAERPLLRSGDIPSEERAAAARKLSELAARAAEKDVAISLELHDDGLLDTPEACLEMVERLGAAHVGVNPDLGNYVRSCAAPVDWKGALERLAPFANNWHVKNYRGQRPTPLWDGDIDYAQALAVMQAAGYDGWVSIESYCGDVLDLQERSLDYLRQLVSRGSAAAAPVQEPAA